MFALQTFPIIRYALFPFLEWSVTYFNPLLFYQHMNTQDSSEEIIEYSKRPVQSRPEASRNKDRGRFGRAERREEYVSTVRRRERMAVPS